MRLDIKNIGLINKASIDFDGITILAGENGTGKSTVSLSLYNIFRTMYQIEDNAYFSIINRIQNVLRKVNLSTITTKQDIYNGYILSLLEMYRKSKINIDDFINFFSSLKNNGINFLEEDKVTAINDLKEIFSHNLYEYEILEASKHLRTNFGKNISNVNNDSQLSSIILNLKKEKDHYLYQNYISINNNTISNLTITLPINYNAIYYSGFNDTSFSQFRNRQDGLNLYNNKYSRNEFLSRNLLFDDIDGESFYDKNIDLCNLIFDSFGELGKIFYEKGDLFYINKKLNKKIEVCKISSGLKSIMVLRQLILTGNLSSKMVLILDEPEVNLHPQWQIYLAESICKMQKNLNLTILISSHSPDFIRAIEVNSVKMSIKDKVNYYNTLLDEKGYSVIKKVNGSSEIYHSLYSPIEKMEGIV